MLNRLVSIPPGLFTPDGERLNGYAYLFLVLLCLAFFTPGFFTIPPTDRDESSFAQASKQMIESGDYTHIRLQDHDRYRKPVGIYWLQAASVRMFNPQHLNEIWAYRLPSLLGATIAVLMTAALGTLLFGPLTGLLAAIMIAGCALLNVEARLAKTDAALLASTMIMQYGLARAYLDYGTARIGLGIRIAFWTALGIGILIKGPVILLIFASTLLWLRVSEGNIKWFAALNPLIGVPCMLLLIAPWFVDIIIASHGQFIEQSAGHDLLGKLWQGQDRGIMPPGLHLLMLPIAFFPFGLWAMIAAPDSWANRSEPCIRFCLGWLIPAWIVFEISLTKLPHYTLPLYPAIALLAAKALIDGYPVLAERRWRWVPPVAIALWFISGMFFALAAVVIPHILNQTWNAGQIAAGLLLLIAQGASMLLMLQRKESSILVMAAGGLIYFTSTFAGVIPNLQHIWISRDIVQTAASLKPCIGPLDLSSSYTEPSLIFMAGTETHIWPSSVGVALDMKADPCRIGVIDNSNLKQFLDATRNDAVQPKLVAAIGGFMLSRGGHRTISFYLMPQKAGSP
jgi:4-amino-4-deoxy-L-arabinose transferase-like glycosyltransferase